MNRFDRVKVRGTEVTGTVLEIENKRDFNHKLVLFVTVALDDGNIMVYDVSEVKVINSL